MKAISVEELRALEGRYRENPFPSFSEWRGSVLGRQPEELAQLMDVARMENPGEAALAKRFLERAFAVDTGALEGLYPTDAGLTLTIAMEGASWQTRAEERGDLLRFFSAQLKSFDLLMDGVTGELPLVVEAWLRRLHEEICEPQDTYKVQTAQGVQEKSLRKGEYKREPNHVLTAEGTWFAYAPPADTPSEMERFVAELNSSSFSAADPIIQASYAHYAFIRIHPFADGNGRVARALATLYLTRRYGVPLLILVDQKNSYLAALRAADAGNHQAFINFVYERTTEAQELFIQRIQSSRGPSLDDLMNLLRGLVQPGDLGYDDADAAAYRLHAAAIEALRTEVGRLSLPSEFQVEVTDQELKPATPKGFRPPIRSGGRRVALVFRTVRPVEFQIVRGFVVALGMGDEDGNIILCLEGASPQECFRERISALHPECSHRTRIRLAIWAEEQVKLGMESLRKTTSEELAKRGYLPAG